MKKILTIILDGFSMREDIYGNAVKNAGMNNFINIWNNYPHCLLKSSGRDIGLPKEQCGNSELGHKIIGTGTIPINKLAIINRSIEKHSLLSNNRFIEMLNYLKKENKNIHIIFLASDGGVSSHLNHLKHILNLLDNQGITKIYLHLITDGIDSPKNSAMNYINAIERFNKNAKVATICGRYYALDDTGDYKRTQNYYELIMNGTGVLTPSIPRIVDICYKRKLSDEYLPPIRTTNYIPIENDDVILFLNYSKTNQEQLYESLTNKDFNEFPTVDINLKVYSIFNISDKNVKSNFFGEEKMYNTLCEYIGDLGLTQAKVMESIKQKSMTYYLDGSRNININNCDTFVVPSPKIDNIDKKPEMNALSVAKVIINCMEKDYDFIIANFANPDIIGHTGNYQATINGLQAIDVCLGKIIEVANDNFYKVIILGDHGKADTLIDRDNNIIPQNTLAPVPFIIMDSKIKLKNGDLSMVTPTILKYMDIALPKTIKNKKSLFD